jgi:hypothetical protein
VSRCFTGKTGVLDQSIFSRHFQVKTFESGMLPGDREKPLGTPVLHQITYLEAVIALPKDPVDVQNNENLRQLPWSFSSQP